MESRLVAAAVEEGNVYSLADYCFMNATAYACLNQESMTLTYYERCIRLLQKHRLAGNPGKRILQHRRHVH